MRETISRVPVHPLLFAAASPLSLLASNIDQIRPSTALRAVLVSVAFGLIVYVILRFAIGNWKTAALIASVLVVLFSTYGLVYGFVRDAGDIGWSLARHRYLMPLWLVLAAAGILAVIRIKEYSGALTKAFNLDREIPTSDRDAYIDQLIYLNKRLTGILEGSKCRERLGQWANSTGWMNLPPRRSQNWRSLISLHTRLFE